MNDVQSPEWRKELIDRFLVASYGGVASKTLVRAILKRPGLHKRDNLIIRHHIHKRVPPLYLPRKMKVIYLYGDPVQAVLTFFRRGGYAGTAAAGRETEDPGYPGFLKGHCLNLQGNAHDMPEGLTLDRFAENGQDYFRLRDHFQKWTTTPVPYDILLFRADSLWENLPPLYQFLGIPESETSFFPPKRKAVLQRSDISPDTLSRLENMYAGLTAQIRAMPPARIKSASRLTAVGKIRWAGERAQRLYKKYLV